MLLARHAARCVIRERALCPVVGRHFVRRQRFVVERVLFGDRLAFCVDFAGRELLHGGANPAAKHQQRFVHADQLGV